MSPKKNKKKTSAIELEAIERLHFSLVLFRSTREKSDGGLTGCTFVVGTLKTLVPGGILSLCFLALVWEKGKARLDLSSRMVEQENLFPFESFIY